MGWFDEQIRERVRRDNEVFADSLLSMAGVVSGERIARAALDKSIHAKNAIEEILKFYHVKPAELPEGIKELDDQLEYLMRPAGIMRRVVYLDGEWYKDAMGAMLGVLKADGSIVALIPASNGTGYSYMDASAGKRVRLNKETAALFEQEAICFYKPLPQTVDVHADGYVALDAPGDPAGVLRIAVHAHQQPFQRLAEGLIALRASTT